MRCVLRGCTACMLRGPGEQVEFQSYGNQAWWKMEEDCEPCTVVMRDGAIEVLPDSPQAGGPAKLFAQRIRDCRFQRTKYNADFGFIVEDAGGRRCHVALVGSGDGWKASRAAQDACAAALGHSVSP